MSTALERRWFAARDRPRNGAVECKCAACGNSYWLPPSKVAIHKTCSSACAKARLVSLRQARRRQCETCGALFYPRHAQLKAGGGRFCSQKCNRSAHTAVNSPTARAKCVRSFRIGLESGRFKPNAGEKNGKWRGGKAASRVRWLNNGGREWVREYERSHPEVRINKSTRRRTRKGNTRLEYGSIKAIGNLQRWRCAICGVDIAKRYHADHIVPLAKGGKHERLNIQLFCPTCNVRKSAKHPVAYMQERGFLL